jgi:3'-phosphoadenosine 5'-phosphosulfate sulfotransferase (PAPS reductase)/FAD synthetase
VSRPYAIEGPALVSFSGGRTSGYMLRKILNEGLRPDVHVVFADTGKERAETYAFVREVASRWDVPVHWVHREGYFEKLITDRKFLPNPVARFCTQELKIRPIAKFMRARGYEHWTNVIGIRADEPSRVARLRGPTRDRWDNAMPLADARVTLEDVTAFWVAQPFDLQLHPWEGNCDLCFLKARSKRERIIADRPDLVGWWIEQERRMGGTFRKDSPSFAQLAANVRNQGQLFPICADDPTDLGDCICHD